MSIYQPVARTQRLLRREVDGEEVVYDLDAETAHLLNPTVLAVWRLCDGAHSVPQIIDRLAPALGWEASGPIVELALTELDDAGLLLAGPPAMALGMSRRSMLKKLGVAAVVVPTVLTLAASPAAASHITCGAGCPAGQVC